MIMIDSFLRKSYNTISKSLLVSFIYWLIGFWAVKYLVVTSNSGVMLFLLRVYGVEFYRYGFTIVKPVANFLWLIFWESQRSSIHRAKKRDYNKRIFANFSTNH